MNKEDFKVLICDDSILARKSLSAYLANLEFTNIVECANGQEAVDKCNEINPDLIFLDIVMPVKDGVTATKEIMDAHPTAKIVIVSSVGTQTHLKEAIKAGARDFVQKPVDPDLLKQVLDHVISA